MSADRRPEVSRREVLRLGASIPLVAIDWAFHRTKTEAVSIKPADTQIERIDESGFYIPRTSLEEARQNLERILAKDPEDITNADMFSAIADSFASLATHKIEVGYSFDYEGISNWRQIDEQKIYTPHADLDTSIGIFSRNYPSLPRLESAWIDPTNSWENYNTFDFDRHSDGKVTLLRVNRDDLDKDFVTTPYEMPPIQKSLFLISLHQEVKSKIPNQV